MILELLNRIYRRRGFDFITFLNFIMILSVFVHIIGACNFLELFCNMWDSYKTSLIANVDKNMIIFRV